MHGPCLLSCSKETFITIWCLIMKLRNNVMIHQNRTDVTYEVPTTKRFTSFNAINDDLRLTWGREAEGKYNY